MPALETRELVARATYCYDRYGRRYTCNSTWYNWGRWVALAVIVVAAFLLFFLCSCITARRRRKAGRKPFYGTGWVPMGGQAQYNPNYQNTQQPNYGYQGNNFNNNASAPPQYGQQQGGYYGGQQGGAAQDYYGGARGGNDYAPPAGPPPGKDGVVR